MLQTLPQKISLDSLVREALASSEYNQKETRDWLWSRAMSDESVRHALLKLGIDQVLRNHFTAERQAAQYAPREVEQTPELIERGKKKQERRLFWDRYALFGQMPLKVAKQMDLRKSVSARREQAAGNIARAAFEEDVMKLLPNKDTQVGRHFHVDKIISMARAHNAF